MKKNKRRRRGSFVMFAVRALGVAGVFAALLGSIGLWATPGQSPRATVTQLRRDPSSVNSLLFETPDLWLRASYWLLIVGLAVTSAAVAITLLSGLVKLAGRRNVAGGNAALQTALCVALLVGVNVFSFEHYRRWDWTGRTFTWAGWRPGLASSARFAPQFTLPVDVAADLAQLRAPTTVVVYQRHKTFGRLSDKPDAYDYAAERKVVEKVHDLVHQFREFGPQFKVVLLDVEDEAYPARLKEVTDGRPALKAAIDAAPENSIVFHTVRPTPGADGQPQPRESVQRLSFNDFYQLDKSASRQAGGGRGNLVLLPQGVESFARRVLAVEEKRPRIGIAVIHEWLTTEGLEDYSLAGLRKALEMYGFEVTDIVLKKGWTEGEPVPAAYTLGESQLERLEEDLAEYDAVLAVNRQELKAVGAVLEKLKSNLSLDELNRELRPMLRGQRMSEEARKINIIRLEPQIEALKEYMAQQERERAELVAQIDRMPGQERIAEARRMTDVRNKLGKLFAECDLVILPRMTLRNAVVGDRIPARLYRLDEAQTGAVRDYLAGGRPVFALFGPVNEPPDRRSPAPAGPDPIEGLFAQLGIVFGNQTILFNSEAKAFSQRRVNLLATGGEVEIPPVQFEAPRVARPRTALAAGDEAKPAPPNAISGSMKIVAGAAGSADKLEKLKLRHPRPVYFTPVRGSTATAAEFLFTDADSWNEAEPFPTREKTPRYEPAKADDPSRGTRDEETRGPFPIGVAVETTVPPEWQNEMRPAGAAAALLTADGSATAAAPLRLAAQALVPEERYDPPGFRPTRVRVAAVGHGGLFNGPELSPAKEQLLVHTSNWLLGRDERLPRGDRPAWQYPRVELSPRRMAVWQAGTLVALPAAFAFLGALVLLVRKYR